MTSRGKIIEWLWTHHWIRVRGYLRLQKIFRYTPPVFLASPKQEVDKEVI